MSNMSYCRFRNTLGDLSDCEEYFTEYLSGEEKDARLRLLRLCKRIALDYTEEQLNDITEEMQDEYDDEEEIQ